MQEWIDILQAAGMNPGRMDAMTAFELSGKIIHDPVIQEKKLLLARTTGRIPLGTTRRLVEEMSDTERAELRQRVRMP